MRLLLARNGGGGLEGVRGGGDIESLGLVFYAGGGVSEGMEMEMGV